MVCKTINIKAASSTEFDTFFKTHEAFMPMLEESFLKMLAIITGETSSKNNPIVFTPITFGQEWYLEVTRPAKKEWEMIQPFTLDIGKGNAKVLSVILMHYALGECHAKLQELYRKDTRPDKDKSRCYTSFSRALEEVRLNLLYNYDAFEFKDKERKTIFHFTD